MSKTSYKQALLDTSKRVIVIRQPKEVLSVNIPEEEKTFKKKKKRK